MTLAGAGAAESGDPPRRPAYTYDELARFMAGIPTGSDAFQSLEQRSSWLQYARAMEPGWQELETRQLAPMRRWSSLELETRRVPGPVLYPFSGPDLINVTTILPDRGSYILLSLEPVGVIPEFFDVSDFDGFFVGLQQSLSSAIRWDFFQTKELREHLGAEGPRGVLPLLLFFAARDGRPVLDVLHIAVREDGTLEETPAMPGHEPDFEGVGGVRLVLGGRSAGAISTVDYFQVDLGSYSLEQNQAFFSSLAGRGPFTTYLKAASYLMFKPKYVAIEAFILDHSRHVLQDDSGIPVAALKRRGWHLTLYGSYVEPIPLFASRYQEELARAYAARSNVGPLPFGVGYHVRPSRSNLMLATRAPR